MDDDHTALTIVLVAVSIALVVQLVKLLHALVGPAPSTKSTPADATWRPGLWVNSAVENSKHRALDRTRGQESGLERATTSVNAHSHQVRLEYQGRLDRLG